MPEYVGVIAQDMEAIAPYMVTKFTKNGTEYLKVDNSALIYMLVNGMKEQQKTIDELRKTISDQNAMFDKIQQQITELKNKRLSQK